MHRATKILNSNIKGFTLIELLISVAMIAILSVIGIASFEGSTKRAEVKNAAGELKSDLRQLQNLASSGQKRPENIATCEHETFRSYFVVAFPGDYIPGFLAGPTPLPDPPPIFTCGFLLSNGYPYNNDNVVVEAIGKRNGPAGGDSSCGITWIHFLTLNADPNLHCGLLNGLNPSKPTSLSGGADRIYFQLRHRDTSEPLRYRVYVTRFGQIYDEQL